MEFSGKPWPLKKPMRTQTKMRRVLALTTLLAAMATGPALAAGDAAAGEKVFKKCKACHSLEEGKNKVGPSLAGVMGGQAGGVEGYKYSKAMANSEVTWDDASMDAFMTKPKKFLPGTKMSFPGLKKEADRADLIAYLKQETQ